MASIAMCDERFLIKDRAMGGEVFCPERGDDGDYCRHEAVLAVIHEALCHLLEGIALCALSEKGVYFGSLQEFWLWVWTLDESCGKMEWVWKHHMDLEPILPHINYNYYRYGNRDGITEAPVEEKYEWNSDDDNILDNEDMVDDPYRGYINFLGFHPYKEVVFFSQSLRKGLAFHLNSSKIQDLGYLYPKKYSAGQHALIWASLLYTPCWMGEFPKYN
uniref:Uncharacterized protein n=1 Tax=Leersia perrieri TaxID=77586 RepID=A0A0D9VXV4_9ORYZ